MGEYFQLSSNFVMGFFVYIATIYAKSEIIFDTNFMNNTT